MIKRNKKGGDKLISIYWFVILTIIAGGIVMMVNSYYSSPYDVREAEADILAAKIANCIYPAGTAHPDFVSSAGVIKQEFLDNFNSYCTLNVEPEGEFSKSQYYARIDIFRSEKKKDVERTIEIGNLNYNVDCEAKEKNVNMATCQENEFFMMFPGGKIKMIVVTTAIGKVDQNA